ncbi:response regulator [Desulfovibrio sp. JC010]|uniref:response regulator n=1 Tax=Desulfovibrio sp. JC010 TaxID=2593641 RepID=UPI0013D092CE|nr:response regulator [Desulfovibrio sp. JC010]NDV28407.1 response regulator [Desulfovibrio sp. JC010]
MPIQPNNIPTILIIDDEPFNLEFLEIVLKQQGYNILTAGNGRTGRELAEQEQPDLILLDIMMPDENGFECAAVLRISPETSEIPIIFLSALDDESNTSRGYDAGAVDFIVKPFEYKEVINRIKLHLKLNSCARQMQRAALQDTPLRINETAFPPAGARCTFPASPPSAGQFIYETVVLNNKSESHFLLNSTGDWSVIMQEKIKALLAENTGPLFSPSETVRNIGAALTSRQNSESGLTASYIHIDREDGTVTVVNSGSLPVILMRADKAHILIERQSGNLGSLGLGLPPCSTYEINSRDRLFMVSPAMLNSFSKEGEGIRELMEACRSHTGVDLELTCRIVGKQFSKETDTAGILVGVEG